MSVTVTINGSNYTVPVTGDQNWGDYTSTLLQALANNALWETGGTFTLTDDINFGAAKGLLSLYFTSVSSNPAESEVVRFANDEGIATRNQADNADLVLKSNTSDELEYEGNKVLDAADVVNDDTTGGATVPASAEIVKTHGTEIDALDTKKIMSYKHEQRGSTESVDTSLTELMSFTIAADGVYKVVATGVFLTTGAEQAIDVRIYKNGSGTLLQQCVGQVANTASGNDYAAITLTWMGSLVTGDNNIKLQAISSLNTVTAHSTTHWTIVKIDSDNIDTL